jgi:hypothetical protein
LRFHDAFVWSVGDVADECLGGALCLFDPELHDGPARIEAPDERAARIEVARQVCASCPTLDGCLVYALTACPVSGVWAGHTAEELADLAAAESSSLGEVA